MKNKIYLLLLLVVFLSSCGPSFVVWNGMDLLGMGFFGIIIIILIVMVLILWFNKKWQEFKQWWNSKQ